MSKPLKIIFAGTPDFAAQHLLALIQSEHQVIATYCPPDKPAGRGKKLTPCATKSLALEHGIPVYQPINFKDEADQNQLADLGADVMVVVAYGLLLPEAILQAPRLGCINVHGSLLPEWRGAAPIQRAVERGDQETGVTIMQMDKGLDTGDMILKASCPIQTNDTSASIYEKLAELGPKALLETLAQMSAGDYIRTPQDNALATYAAKLDKAEAELDWSMPAKLLDQKVRAYIPWPVAQFSFTDEKAQTHRIRIWQTQVVEQNSDVAPGTIIEANKSGITVATGEQALRLQSLQLPGKKALPAQDILNARAQWFTVGQSIKGFTS
ncbi:methionyl-tRNA formyltransferase [Thalassotalea fusca]